MAIYIQKNNKYIEVNQEKIFNDLYNLGKKLYNYNFDANSIDLTNWDNERILKINKRIYDIKTTLEKTLETYIENFYMNKEVEKIIKKLIEKYGYPNNRRRDILVSYNCTYKDILITSLYTFVIAQLLESIKKDNYYDYENKFIKFSVKKKETILFYINGIINAHSPYCYIDYLNEFRYIFTNWCDVSSLVIFAMLSKINTSTNKYKTIPCSQCGYLFVQNSGKKTCSKECEKENARLRKQKSRKKEKQ